jgi:hypothetical protein
MSQIPESVPGTKAGSENVPTSPDKEAKPGDVSEQELEADAEIGGPKGPEPTRYGDWERKGRCIDF